MLIGGGAVALRKAQTLLEAGARLVVVAEEIDEMLAIKARGGDAELIRSKYSKDYLAGAVLTIAATNDHELNRRIYRDCQQLEILCNVVDEPQLCDFFVPAVVKRGDLQIAIGTEGQCPAYAGHLRKKLEDIFTEDYGKFLAELEGLRNRILMAVSDPTVRKVLLGRLVEDKSFEYFREKGQSAWKQWAEQLIAES